MTAPLFLAGSGPGGGPGGGPRGGSGGNEAGGDGSDSDASDGGGDADGDTSTVERVVIAGSVLLTVALFSFVAWNAVAGPGEASLEVGVEPIETTDGGGTLQEVRLENPGDRGFEHVTVVVECGDPPRTLAFEHLPPQSERRATVVCPAGADDPSASVVSWTSG